MIVYTAALQAADEAVASAKHSLDEATSSRDAVLADALLRCPSCESEQKIKDTTFVVSHYYVSPYSCNGGDYWTIHSFRWECGQCFASTVADETLKSCSNLFKTIEKRYDR